MTNTKFLFGFIVLLTILTMGVRLLPHLPNFTPMGALALFIGAYASKKYLWAMLIPIFAMFASDLFIGFYDLRLMAVVYGSFFVYPLVGMLFTKKNLRFAFLGSVAGATFFYLSTNFAVWAFSSWYPHTFGGLLMSYALALPFFKYTLLGDVFFTGVFFGAYEFIQQTFLAFFHVKPQGDSLSSNH